MSVPLLEEKYYAPHYPRYIGPHHTRALPRTWSQPQTWELIVQWPPDPGVPWIHICYLTVQVAIALTPASDIWWPRLDTFSNLFTWDPLTLLVLIFGGYWSTYGWKVSNTHPTGMLSGLDYLLSIKNTRNERLFPIFSVITYGILTSDCLIIWRCHSCAKISPVAWHIKDKDILTRKKHLLSSSIAGNLKSCKEERISLPMISNPLTDIFHDQQQHAWVFEIVK